MRRLDALGPHDRLAVVRTAPSDSRLQFSTDRAAARAFVRAIRGPSHMVGVVPGELEARTRVEHGLRVA